MNYLINTKKLNSEFILNSLQSPIIIINSIKKTIIYCNNATEVFFDIGKKKIINQKIEALFKKDSYFTSLIKKSIKTNRNINEYNVSIKSPKKDINASVYISKVESDDNLYSVFFIR